MKEIEEEIMIQYYNGSIFDSKADILCHQVNCQGAFGYGIAGQVKKLFPEVEKTYKRITKQWIEKENGDTSKLLGRVSAQPVEKDGRWFLIGNLYGQDDYGRKKMVYTDYDALEKAMGEIRSFLEARGKNETVAFPYKIGCGSAGGDWIFPEGMLKIMLPVGSGLFVKFAFQAAKKYPKECRQTRIDIEKRMCRVLAEWKGAK